MLHRATATFSVKDAWQGNRAGVVIYKDEIIEKRQLHSSLKPSSRLQQETQRKNELKFSKKNEDLALNSTESDDCILCHLLDQRNLKKSSGLLMKKLQHFLCDLVLF